MNAQYLVTVNYKNGCSMYKVLLLVFQVSLLLGGCSTSGGRITYEQSFIKDGGGSIKLPMSSGGPMPAENENYKMVMAGTSVTIKKGEPENSEIFWQFGLQSKVNQPIERVVVEQVTPTGALVLLIDEHSPQITRQTWRGTSKSISMAKNDAPWLYDNTNSTFLFKITIFPKNLAPSQLYQPSLLDRSVKTTYLQILGN
jgi:hypothetical protein